MSSENLDEMTDNGDGTYTDSYGDTYDSNGNLVSQGDTFQQATPSDASDTTPQPANSQGIDSGYIVQTDSNGGMMILDASNQNQVLYSDYVDQDTGQRIVEVDLLGLSDVSPDPFGTQNALWDDFLRQQESAGSQTSQQENSGGGGGGGGQQDTQDATTDDGTLVLDPFQVTGQRPTNPTVSIDTTNDNLLGQIDFSGMGGGGSTPSTSTGNQNQPSSGLNPPPANPYHGPTSSPGSSGSPGSGTKPPVTKVPVSPVNIDIYGASGSSASLFLLLAAAGLLYLAGKKRSDRRAA